MVEQLIVGVLLFVPLLALLPTSLMWYGSAALTHTAMRALQAAASLGAQAMQHNLLLLLALRAVQPHCFPSGMGGGRVVV